MLAAMLIFTACGAAGEPAADESNAVTTDESDAVAADESDAVTTDESDAAKTAGDAELADGTYLAEFETDSSMFHVNEEDEGKGVLTVKDGTMMIHIRMPSKNIVNLYFGLKEDAQKEGAELIQPQTEEVEYSDGTTGEVYSFDIPVPVIGEEFDVALIGTHGNWYDHKVIVKDPVAQ